MDTKPHAELPLLDQKCLDSLKALEEYSGKPAMDMRNVGVSKTYIAECRERQLLAALQSIAALTARAEKAEMDLVEAERIARDEDVYFSDWESVEKHISAIADAKGLPFVLIKAGELTRNAIAEKIARLRINP